MGYGRGGDIVFAVGKESAKSLSLLLLVSSALCENSH